MRSIVANISSRGCCQFIASRLARPGRRRSIAMDSRCDLMRFLKTTANALASDCHELTRTIQRSVTVQAKLRRVGQARFERRPTMLVVIDDVVHPVVDRRGEAPLVPPYNTPTGYVTRHSSARAARPDLRLDAPGRPIAWRERVPAEPIRVVELHRMWPTARQHADSARSRSSGSA